MQEWKYKEHKDAVFDEDGSKACKAQYGFSVLCCIHRHTNL